MNSGTNGTEFSQTIEARIERESFMLGDSVVRLQMRRRHLDGVSYLKSDGAWAPASEGAGVDGAEYGIALPAGAVQAVSDAIDAFLGRSSHHDTEVALLREWLTVERARNERLISAIAGSGGDAG